MLRPAIGERIRRELGRERERVYERDPAALEVALVACGQRQPVCGGRGGDQHVRLRSRLATARQLSTQDSGVAGDEGGSGDCAAV